MLQVSKLHHLKILNLAQNRIQSLEGLRELKLLTWLSLAQNQIRVLEPLLTQNVHLEHLDLSDNRISHLSDLSYLKNLKVHFCSHLGPFVDIRLAKVTLMNETILNLEK